MSSKRSSKKSKSRAAEFLQKPRGVIHPRVQKVGPEHFGIVCVDCAKARSKWMLTDFYGRVLVPPKKSKGSGFLFQRLSGSALRSKGGSAWQENLT